MTPRQSAGKAHTAIAPDDVLSSDRCAPRPVLADVARLAQVSSQTVSRVVNGHPNVRAATRERVHAAMRVLEYRPNLAARALSTRRTGALAVISTDSAQYGPASIVAGVERGARIAGYSVTVASVGNMGGTGLARALDRLRHSVDGIVVVARHGQAEVGIDPAACPVPVVLVGSGTSMRGTWLGVDNVDGAHRATAFLLELGHQTVHHLAGPRSSAEARAREAGWRQALAERGIRVPPPVRCADWSPRSGRVAGTTLVEAVRAHAKPVTAVLCAGDHLALGLMRAAQHAGLRVPEDVSVVGFDDLPDAEFFGPALTTVRQDFGELGRCAAEALIEAIEPPEVPAGHSRTVRPRVALHLELIVRRSAAPPLGHGTPALSKRSDE